MSEPLLLAASLLSGEAVGVTPPNKPEVDPWQALDQMSLLDKQRVEAYQRRSQPLAMQAQPPRPEAIQTLPKSQVTYGIADRLPNTSKITPRPSTVSDWRSPSKVNFNQPTSGPQLYQQRLAALKQGQLYTRIKGNSFQTTWTNATQQPTHEQWQQLLRQEANSVAKGQGKNRLGVLVGDSLSMWFPNDLLPEGKLWLNQGISGENSTQILQRLDALNNVRPETIYVMAGVNDLKQGASDATVLNNTRTMIRRLQTQHPYTTVILQSLLPTRQSYLPPERAVRLNQQLQAIAQQENAGYLNLHALFADEEGKLRQDLSTDGLHLNRNGYEVWQGAMQQAENWVIASK